MQQEQRAGTSESWQDQQQAACPLEAVEAPAVRNDRSWSLQLQAVEHMKGQAKEWRSRALTDCQAPELAGTGMHHTHMYAWRAHSALPLANRQFSYVSVALNAGGACSTGAGEC